jgi:hypothetical protein
MRGLRYGLLALLVLTGACTRPGDFDRFRMEGEFRNEQEFLEVLAGWFCFKIVDCESKLGIAGVGFQLICHPGVLDVVGIETVLRAHPLGPGPEATFDLDAARLCRDALFDLPRCELPGQVLPEACRQVYQGSLSPGARCVADSECARGRCEFVHNRCPEGLCVERVEEGGACGANEECEVNLVCRGNECQPVGQQGEVCDENEGLTDCDELLWCDGGTCQPLPNVGDDCATGFGVDPCRGSLVCSGVFGGQCVAGGEAGDSCNRAGDPPCAPGHRCDRDAHRCVTLLRPGEEGCSSALNCPFLHECDGIRCVPLPIAGEACSPVMPCLEGACVDRTCTLLPDGEPCTGESALGECAGFCASAEGGGRMCTPHRTAGEACELLVAEPQCADGLACILEGLEAHCIPCGELL